MLISQLIITSQTMIFHDNCQIFPLVSWTVKKNIINRFSLVSSFGFPRPIPFPPEVILTNVDSNAVLMWTMRSEFTYS